MIFAVSESRVSVVRRFNRFLTRQIGVLREGLLHSPYSLTESRILFELASRDIASATDLRAELGLDGGYLSRTLKKFEQKELIARVRSDTDKRQRLIQLTQHGLDEFSVLDARSQEEASEMLSASSEDEQQNLIRAMQAIESTLNQRFKYADPFYLRHHEAGDMGWVIRQHGLVYKQEYGWNESFESFVARICADFIDSYDVQKERCWIAEMQSQPVGSIFCVKESEDVAKLRMLIVDKKARGLGLGTRLVEECIRFARNAEYKRIELWTNDVLIEARHIYEKQGFRPIAEEKHYSFGHELTGQNWSLVL